MEEIRTILRTYQALKSVKGTARAVACAKGTVRRYVRWAAAHGHLEGTLPTEAELARAWSAHASGAAVVREDLAVHHAVIAGWLEQGIPLVRIQGLLTERHGWRGSYATLKRSTAPLRVDRKVTVRIETGPGEQAQVDFGHLGPVWDTVERRMRKGWLFLMVLSHSRHAYGEVVFRQDVSTWVMLHIRAFEWFGGVPKTVVVDNLKAAIVQASVYDPVGNRTYQELAEGYGFVISACRPSAPQHKGKVERGVPYVRRSFYLERRGAERGELNAALKVWLRDVAGTRVHGTTQCRPLDVYEAVERVTMTALPAERREPAIWKEATVHADCHVSVEGAYYSVPYGLRGTKVLVRLTSSMAHVYADSELVASHVRAGRPGARHTVLAHYPPEKAAWLEATPAWCVAEAARVGVGAQALIGALLHRSHPLDGLRGAQGILGFGRRVGAARLEAACARAVEAGLYTYGAVKRILAQGLEGAGAGRAVVPVPRTFRHARPLPELLLHLPAKEV